MRTTRFSISMVFSILFLFYFNIASAEELDETKIFYSAPLPDPEDFSAELRYDRGKSLKYNSTTRAKITAKIKYWSRQMASFDPTRPMKQGAVDLKSQVEEKFFRRDYIAQNLQRWELKLAQFDIESLCGVDDESQDVELYDGLLGVSRSYVEAVEKFTAQIQWNSDIASSLSIGDSAGNVSGLRWCTGTLIKNNLLITAGHCFLPNLNSYVTPSRNGEPLLGGELAKLMHVNFNYQIDRSTGIARSPTVFPVTGLLEYKQGNLDYAIAELGPSADGIFPNSLYGEAAIDASKSTLDALDLVAIIQHPDGLPKRIAVGKEVSVKKSQIRYKDADTQNASSGAGIFDRRGSLVGVHTDGGCNSIGRNFGVAAEAIKKVSSVLQ